MGTNPSSRRLPGAAAAPAAADVPAGGSLRGHGRLHGPPGGIASGGAGLSADERRAVVAGRNLHRDGRPLERVLVRPVDLAVEGDALPREARFHLGPEVDRPHARGVEHEEVAELQRAGLGEARRHRVLDAAAPAIRFHDGELQRVVAGIHERVPHVPER
jgi:hypothetical protein